MTPFYVPFLFGTNFAFTCLLWEEGKEYLACEVLHNLLIGDRMEAWCAAYGVYDH